jgi:hypothetical protein
MLVTGSVICDTGEVARLSRRPRIPGLVSGDVTAIPENGEDGDTDRGLLLVDEEEDDKDESSLSGEDTVEVEPFEPVDTRARLLGGRGGLLAVLGASTPTVVALEVPTDDEDDDGDVLE